MKKAKPDLELLMKNSGALDYVPDEIFSGYGRLVVARPKTMKLNTDGGRPVWEAAEKKRARREERNRKLQEAQREKAQ